MFIAAVISAFVVAHVAAEIPSYIHVCGRKNPNIEQCVMDSVLSLKDKICEGIPELDVPPIEPLILADLGLLNTSNTKIFLENVQIKGLCDYKIHSLHIDLEKNSFDVDLTFRRLEINATYDVNLRILLPIAAKGLIFITTENVSSKAYFNLKTVMKSGKKYAYLSEMKVDLDIKGYETHYSDNLMQPQLQEAVTNFVGTNQKDIINIIKPSIERMVSERILTSGNLIVKHFTYDELFPDRM